MVIPISAQHRFFHSKSQYTGLERRSTVIPRLQLWYPLLTFQLWCIVLAHLSLLRRFFLRSLLKRISVHVAVADTAGDCTAVSTATVCQFFIDFSSAITIKHALSMSKYFGFFCVMLLRFIQSMDPSFATFKHCSYWRSWVSHEPFSVPICSWSSMADRLSDTFLSIRTPSTGRWSRSCVFPTSSRPAIPSFNQQLTY